jgi:serine/threonine protein kinase
MSELRTALADALGPLYRVEREVRPAGQHRQFVVTEIPNGPAFLVKVLTAGESFSKNENTFERDLLLLADRLRHPNLVPPKGGGRAGAFIYHTRAFIEGTTLHAWMARNGQLPLARTVEVLRGILTGLAHAHKNKVAHGDLRPESVILGKDDVHLADTGIKKLLGGAALVLNDMATLATMVHEMLTGNSHGEMDEPVERNRTLPAWLSEWLRTQWKDAGSALAGLRPPPTSGSWASQPYV